MGYEFRLPDLGEGVREGEVVDWLVEPGQTVAEDDPMVEVETDKATVEIPCPVDGTVAELHAAVGDTVPVGGLLITIAADGELVGSGPVAAPMAARPTPQDGAPPEVEEKGRPEGRREPLRGMRRRIGDRLARSHREVPKVTVVEECDFTKLAAERGEVSYVPFVVRAVVAGLREFPDFNATIDDEDIVYLDRLNVGVAAQGPNGLVVPVLHDADRSSIEELDAEVARLAQDVREETIAAADLRGGTFTVTLAGRLGGFFATPLVNLGESAILGVHRIQARPVVRECEIVVRQIGLVSCSFDHRITDGTRASMFLLRVIEELEKGKP